jgi:hypothetical protein
VVFVDHLHRHETLSGIGQGDRGRSGIEVEYARGIERVAIEADHRLIVDRCGFPAVKELSEATLLHQGSGVGIGFGADEVIGGDGHRIVRRRGSGERGQRQCGGANNKIDLHATLPLLAMPDDAIDPPV